MIARKRNKIGWEYSRIPCHEKDSPCHDMILHVPGRLSDGDIGGGQDGEQGEDGVGDDAQIGSAMAVGDPETHGQRELARAGPAEADGWLRLWQDFIDL